MPSHTQVEEEGHAARNRRIMGLIVDALEENRLRVHGRVHADPTITPHFIASGLRRSQTPGMPSLGGAQHPDDVALCVRSGTTFEVMLTGFSRGRQRVELDGRVIPCNVAWNECRGNNPNETSVWLHLSTASSAGVSWFWLEVYVPAPPAAA